MSTEDIDRRRNLEMQLEAWQDSEEFEERFMTLFNKVRIRCRGPQVQVKQENWTARRL
jgi:hypothetical protein